MIKSQKQRANLFLLFLFILSTLSFSAFSETAKEKLALADSLFELKKYTQSFELYESILKSEKKASPAMILKMAFIKEGLGDYTNALYYLNLYYLSTYNKRVLKKMENLAEQNKLSGYDYDDAEFFLNLYHQYQLQVDLILLSVTLLLFAMLFRQKRKFGRISVMQASMFASFLVLLFVLNSFGREQQKAIISASGVHLMDGPSPGSNVIEVVSQGHRVDIIGQEDVWIKISWNDQEAYVKSFNLKSINL